MLISVIIPHLDDLNGLARCLAALEHQSQPRESFEIIVADNGSHCGLEVVRSCAPTALVISVAERGAGPARNSGVAASRGSMLAFTDSDCLPDRDWLKAGIAALKTSEIVGGAMHVSSGDSGVMTATEAFESVFAFDNRTYVEQHGFSVTANLFTTKDVFDRTGPFPNGVSEDVAWCRAAQARGFRIAYAGTARVTHPARNNFYDLSRKWRRLTGETYALWQAEGRSRVGWILRAGAVLASPLYHAGRIIRSPALPDLGTRVGALAVLVRIRAARSMWMMQAAMAKRDIAQRPLSKLQGVGSSS